MIILPHAIQFLIFGSWVLLLMGIYPLLHKGVQKLTGLAPLETIWWVRWVILSISAKLSLLVVMLVAWGLTVLLET